MHSSPSLSVVLPMFNAPEFLERSLAALRASSVPFELVVVDDCSTDERAPLIAQQSGARYLRLAKNSGPAVARNAGAKLATGDVIVFIDSDVVVERDTLAQIAQVFRDEPDVAACFGSYDDEPAHASTVSTYRNLLHHYVHQRGPREASTFWAGCGGVRRSVFAAVGGFDESYARPSIEDIELGMRIKAAGHSIRLAPSIQCKHQKRWRLVEMVKVDVARRAIPWTHLLIDRPGTGGDLNLDWAQKLCVVLVFLALLALPAATVATWRLDWTQVWCAPPALLAPVLWINRGLYALFLRKRGVLFALAGILLHLLYYVYGGLAFLYAHATHRSTRRSAVASSIATLSAFAVLAACSDSEAQKPATPPAPTETAESLPRTARKGVLDELELDLATARSPADGGGKVWLEPAPASSPSVQAAQSGTWTLSYEAGPLGVALGGAIYLQVSPFWEWSTPQNEDEDAPGFTRATTAASGVELELSTLDRQLMRIAIRGRDLHAGERVRIEYGAGTARARGDSFAERGSRFWIAVDGDGDGVRKVIEDSPGVDVLPRAPEMLVLTLPSTAHPGDRVRLCAALLDSSGNAGCDVSATIDIEDVPTGIDAPAQITLTPADRGRTTVECTARETGTYRLKARAKIDGRELTAESNPMLVAATGPRILWADLHGHSAESDGTGTPEDYFQYARDVAALDVVSLTDHDHWGILFLDRHPERWSAIVATTKRFHEPGRFVALAGFEWTSWIYGHRHVVYFGDTAELLNSIDPPTSTPQGLWSALRGKSALTFAHHSAGGPIATDWSIAPDPELEPATEIVSVHGVSESADAKKRIYSPVAGNFVRDALERGYRFGFVGSGDSHDGHPGLAHLGEHNPCSGLAAILSEELTRESVLAALRARRVYATTGERILLRFSFGGVRMGESVTAARAAANPLVFVSAIGTGPIRVIELIRSGAIMAEVEGDGSAELALTGELSDARPGEYVYARVEQTDGAMAWSSPIYVD